MTEPNRIVHHGDALIWLKENGIQENASFITSMPDFTEFPSLSLAEWSAWFTGAAQAVLESCPENGVSIFYQRDSKKDGAWVNKAYLIQKAAEAAGHAQLWHKIICRVPPGNITFGKPAYSHLLCFSKGVRPDLTKSTADVVLMAGKTTWARGMGTKACEIACRFILENTDTRTVVDPFCGQGAVLAIANKLGLAAVGVELSRKRAEKAQALEMSLEGAWSLPRA
ncbi:MAG: SAM-dependent methyltransferase [Bacteriovoracia bacterium]